MTDERIRLIDSVRGRFRVYETLFRYDLMKYGVPVKWVCQVPKTEEEIRHQAEVFRQDIERLSRESGETFEVYLERMKGTYIKNENEYLRTTQRFPFRTLDESGVEEGNEL